MLKGYSQLLNEDTTSGKLKPTVQVRISQNNCYFNPEQDLSELGA